MISCLYLLDENNNTGEFAVNGEGERRLAHNKRNSHELLVLISLDSGVTIRWIFYFSEE